jgi:hypothetical protein
MGGCAPQGPPPTAQGMRKGLRPLRLACRRLCEPSCRRRGLTGVYPCVKKVLEHMMCNVMCNVMTYLII